MATTIDSGLFRNPNRDLVVNIKGTKKPVSDDYAYPKQDWFWTGKRPVFGECPGVAEDGHMTSLPLPDVSEKGTRQQLLDYFDNTWTLTEVLFSGLQGREVFLRSPWHQLRHPLIFYYGHVAALYINKLRVAGLIKDPVDEELEQIVETGVDEMSWDDLSKNDMEWPDLRRITEYRRTVYGIVKNLILDGDWSFPIRINDPAWALIMGYEHERIHLETSSVLIRELPAHLVTLPAQFPKNHPSAFDGSSGRKVQNEMLSVEAGEVHLGKPHDFRSFGWDNEYGTRSAQVAGFTASKFLITNGEFLEFVRAGGYGNRAYWTEAGWQWRVFRNIHFPTFWCPDGPVGLHQYKMRAIFDVIDLPLSWPVDVNVHEAKAYCAWKTLQDKPQHPYRLITENEHNMLRDASTRDLALGAARDPVMVQTGSQMASRKGAQYNSNLAWGSQSPVDALAPSSTGFHDVFGNAWHWTEDDFNMLDGFEVSPLYVDFSTPCFDGLHNIIMGGSFMSTGDEASIFSRFHFRPHFHQHASFRMCSGPNVGVQLPKLGTNGLSSAAPNLSADMEGEVDERMLNQYGTRQDVQPWESGPDSGLSFPARIAKVASEWAREKDVSLKRVLDLGCTVGGCSMELAKTVPEVVGVDFPHLIAAAEEMKRDGQRLFNMKEEGDVYTELLASVDSKIDRTRVNFKPVDPCGISAADSGSFNAVVMTNLLERLPAPAQCLENLVGKHGLVKPGGLLILSTTGSWSTSYTPKSQWLGGYKDEAGNEVRTLDGIKAVMAGLNGELQLIHREDVPMLMRQDARNFQFKMVETTVWQRQTALDDN